MSRVTAGVWRTFFWHECARCMVLGYRKSIRGTHLKSHYQRAQLDPVTFSKVIEWHEKLANEMWADYLKTSVNNLSATEE